MRTNLQIFTTAILSMALVAEAHSADPIILSETAAENLRIQTVDATPADFTETLFTIGRVEPIPARKSVLSSRVAGRISAITAFEGDRVEAGQTLLEIESLQPGNPPPRIPLQAPQAGMVMKSHTHLGKPVVPENELFEIIDLSEVYAVARLPEDQAGKVGPGTLARIRVATLPDKVFEGELVRFGTTANPQSGTIDAFFILENPDYRLRPNMRAEFSIVLESKSATTAVPKAALQSDGLNHFVFVEDFDLPNAYVKTPVITGPRNETHVEILRGLLPGDKVVTEGSYALMFAGAGTISLKEALDAAHGHEHNEDGSEMTAAQRRAKAEARALAQGGSRNQGPLVTFLSILSGLLLLLLILSIVKRRSA